jgi:hypothetical protein
MEDQRQKPKRKKRISIRKAIMLAEQACLERAQRGEKQPHELLAEMGFKRGNAPSKIGDEWVH